MATTGKALIFVSCGQATEAEKTLGLLIKAVIDGTPGFEAYFAETVQDLESLGRHVLDGLRRCDGAVVVMHDRGLVTLAGEVTWGNRSSVWVNQEVAILAYRQFFEARTIPILAFADPKVKLEGAMTSLIVNPRPFSSPPDVVAAVKSWLEDGLFRGGSDEAFRSKWDRLSDAARMVVVALIDEGGHIVKEQAVRDAVARLFQIGKEPANQALREAKMQFLATDVVKLIDNIHSGHEMSVHPTWEYQLKRNAAQWRDERGSR